MAFCNELKKKKGNPGLMFHINLVQGSVRSDFIQKNFKSLNTFLVTKKLSEK